MESIGRRIAMLAAAAVLVTLPLLAGGCKSTPKKYCDEYTLILQLDPKGDFKEPAIHLVVMLCDDRDEYRAPEFKDKAGIERWLRDEDDKTKRNLEALGRMRKLNIDTSRRGAPTKVLLPGTDEKLGPGAKIFVVANFATSENVSDHYRTILLDSPEVCEHTIEIRPGWLKRVEILPEEGE